MASRSAYFRSSETANACLWLFSSRRSSEALAVGREEGVPVEQRRRGLQGGVLGPAQDLIEVEAEQPVVRPLPPFDQQDSVEGEQEHPARRVVPPEDAARDHVVPGGVEQFRRRRRLPVELRRVRVEGERVVAFALRVERVQHEELRRPVAEAVRRRAPAAGCRRRGGGRPDASRGRGG